MKQLITFFAAVVLLAAFTPTVWAYNFYAVAPSGQTLYYNIVDGNAEVTPQYHEITQTYSGYPSGDLTIPSTVTNNGTTYPVTSIGEYAFMYCRDLTSVTIPNSVTFIGNEAFRRCSGLTSITIPNSVTTIEHQAFCDCSGLTSVILGNSVTSIGNSAFNGCSGLTGTLTIPNSVTSIGYRAFSGCSGITGTLTIPNSVTSIGERAFYDCSGLTAIIVENDNTIYDSRNNCNALIETATNTLLLGCENTIIPNSVTSIVDYAFYNCSGLTSVILGNSVTSIGNSAFYGCSGISEIHSLAYVAPTLGSTAFYGVTNTIPVYIPCGASASYYSRWSYFSNFIEGGAFTFSAVSADNNMGAVQILTMPTCTNPQAVIYASANSGYRFDHWSDGSTANPYTLTVTTDMNLTAYFVSAGGGTESIDDIAADQIKIYSRGSEIVIEGDNNTDAIIYDIMGRIIHKGRIESPIRVNNTGVYMVKIGNRQPQKVVVR